MERGQPRVERQGDAESGSSYTAGAPDERVRTLLARHYLGFTETAASGETWLEPPRGTVTVILNLGEPFGGLPDAFVAGLTDTYSVIQRGDATCCVDLKLKPLGAYTLLGVPMHEIGGRVVDIRDVLGPAAGRLLDRLREAPHWEDRFELLDGFLLERAASGPRPAPAVAWAWRRLAETGGQVRIRQLAGEVGCSPKHLVAMFRRQVGLPPKTVARIARFNGLLRRLEQEGGVPWAQLALDAGYYDQPHLHRDFRQFVGVTPAEFLARHRPSWETHALAEQV